MDGPAAVHLLPVVLPISPDFSLFVVFDALLSYPRSPPVAFLYSTALIPGLHSVGNSLPSSLLPSEVVRSCSHSSDHPPVILLNIYRAMFIYPNLLSAPSG